MPDVLVCCWTEVSTGVVLSAGEAQHTMDVLVWLFLLAGRLYI